MFYVGSIISLSMNIKISTAANIREYAYVHVSYFQILPSYELWTHTLVCWSCDRTGEWKNGRTKQINKQTKGTLAGDRLTNTRTHSPIQWTMSSVSQPHCGTSDASVQLDRTTSKQPLWPQQMQEGDLNEQSAASVSTTDARQRVRPNNQPPLRRPKLQV